MINYRRSPLSIGTAGGLHGGDRLPWVGAEGTDNYRPLATPVWQAHIYGVANSDLIAWCQRNGLPLHVFPWRPAYAASGLAEDALYVLRPNTYIALAQEAASTDELFRYFADRGLRLPGFTSEPAQIAATG